MKKNTYYSGTSLIELIVVLAISAIMLLIISTVITNSVTALNSGVTRMNLLQDLDTASFIIEKSIREGVDSKILNSGKKIEINDSSGGIKNIWQDNTLMLASLGSGTTNFVAENVESLNFSVAITTYPAVQYELILKKNNQDYKVNSIIRHRSNF